MVREIINAKNSCHCPRLLYSTWKKSNIRSNRNRFYGIWIKNHIVVKWIFYNFFCLRVTKKDIKVLFVTNKRFCDLREFDNLIAKKLAGDFIINMKYIQSQIQKCRIGLIDTVVKVRKPLMEGHFEFVLFSNPVGSIVFLYSGRWPKFVKMILDSERTVYGMGAKLFGIGFL